jgi:regulatory protein
VSSPSSRSPRQPPSLRARALAWLTQREHSRQELADKLARWIAARQREAVGGDGHQEGGDPGRAASNLPSADEIEPLLDALERAGHLSDRRFVESRVHARAPRFGNLRIQLELRRLGAQPDDGTLAQLRATEAERARAVWAARFGRAPIDATEKARQARFLAGRGFSAEAIRHALGPVADQE